MNSVPAVRATKAPPNIAVVQIWADSWGRNSGGIDQMSAAPDRAIPMTRMTSRIWLDLLPIVAFISCCSSASVV